MLVGYDIDGVVTQGITPTSEHHAVIISGRTFAEYDERVRALSQQFPTYIRGAGRVGDRQHAGRFKAMMIEFLGVEEFHENDRMQAQIIQKANPELRLVLH